MLIDPKTMRYASILSSAVLLKILLIYGGFRFGGWLDSKLHTAPFLMVAGLTVGAGLGVWYVLFCVEKFKSR